jgi:multicomponent Na+:H+ antiporter subunit G
LISRNVYERLHYIAPGATLGSILVCGAIVVNEGTSQAGLKAIVVAVLLVSTGPVLVHATARAARVREIGKWDLRESEREHLAK